MAAEIQHDIATGGRRTWAQIASKVLHADGLEVRLASGARVQHLQPCPETWPELVHVEVAHSDLATDQEGRALRQEMDAWFRTERVRDEGMRDAYRLLWRALESERSRFVWEKHERLREASER